MSKTFNKIIAVGVCAALCLGGIGSMVYALNSTSNTSNQDETSETNNEIDSDIEEISKDETVYVLAGADGAVRKIIVSDWIKNAVESDKISDVSSLSNIENVKGDETYTLDSNNAKVWDAEGNDIYYKGDINKELPVNIAVSYKLDGKAISPSELAGKSGKVSIKYTYTNNQYENVVIDGVSQKIYVPFAMLTGTILKNDTFKNVEVTNGKLINDGDKTAIIGLAFPGLQENLNISKDKFEIPNYFEITADVTNFELGTTITVATNELFNHLDIDKVESIDDLDASISKLNTAMNELIDGSSQLYNGLDTLLNKSQELISGIDKLADGANQLKNGANDLDSGADKLQSGMSELSNGLDKLASNNDALNGGAKQVFETLLSTAKAQIIAAGIDVPDMTIDNYADVLNEVISSLDETKVYNTALKQVTDAVNANRGLITEKVTETVKAQVSEKVNAVVREQVSVKVTEAVKENVTAQVIMSALNMDKETYENAVSAGLVSEENQQAINAAIEHEMQSDEVKSLIETNTNTQMQGDEVKSTIEATTNAQMQAPEIQDTIADNVELQVNKAISENMASNEVQSKLKAASEGAKSIISLKSSLDNYNAFYLGLIAYTNGVSDAAKGAKQLNDGTANLKNGTAKLSSGANELYNGILTLKDGTPALVDGVSKLKNGSMQLSDGLKEFNEQGVQKLVSAVNGDLKGLVERIKATADVSKNYKSFSGLSDDMSGEVKFIYKTDEIR